MACQTSNPPILLCVCVSTEEDVAAEDGRGVGSWAPARGKPQLWACLLTLAAALCVGLGTRWKRERAVCT